MSRKTAEAWLRSKEKRAFDIGLAGSVAPVILPLTLAAAALVTATEQEQPFITQTRVGRGGTPLKIAKLRTMPHGTEETMSNGHYDERRTKLGRIISMTRLDEAPQLYNVLRGSMSMVGLRPLVQVHHDQFMDSLSPDTRRDVDRAYSIARPGWFDPYGVYLYVHGKEDTHQARAESILKYTFEEASARRDLQIICQAMGIVKNIVHDNGIDLLPVTNPEPVLPPEEQIS